MSRTRTLLTVVLLAAGCHQPRDTADADRGRPNASQTPARDAQPGFATPEALIEACIAAVNNQDRAAYQAAIHPKSLAAINDDNRHMFEKLYAREFEKPISERERTITFSPYSETDPLILSGDFGYLIPPSKLVAVRCETTYHVYQRRLWAVVEDDGRWFLQVPIPSVDLVQRIAAQKDEDAQFRLRAREIVAEIQEPLKAELAEYIRQGRSHTAARRYRQEYGVDMRDAKMVIEALESMLQEAGDK